VLKPSSSATQNVKAAFDRGVPYDGMVALGDLINAAWEIFRAAESTGAEGERKVADYLSDLVLKSAEISEIKSIMR